MRQRIKKTEIMQWAKQQLKNEATLTEKPVKLTAGDSGIKGGKAEDRGITFSKCAAEKAMYQQSYTHRNHPVKSEDKVKTFPDQQKLRDYIDSPLPSKNY